MSKPNIKKLFVDMTPNEIQKAIDELNQLRKSLDVANYTFEVTLRVENATTRYDDASEKELLREHLEEIISDEISRLFSGITAKCETK
jgi:hypothetical protein